MIPESPAVQEAILCLPAELTYLPAFLDHVRRMAELAGVADAQIARLELAVEEALVNVVSYAYGDRRPAGTVQCRVVAQPESLRVEIADEGPPFDPLTRPDPDTALELEQREPGGLGILLIKSLASEVAYRREGNQNVLRIEMRRDV